MKNQKGFMLMEALIVTTVLGVTLIYAFIQFNILNKSYDKTYNFNNVNSLYKTNMISNYLKDSGFVKLVNELNNNKLYADFTKCDSSLTNNSELCGLLMSELEVDYAYFLKEDLTSFKNHVLESESFTENFKEYIKYISYDTKKDGFRLIVVYKDKTVTSINFL